DFHEAVNFAAVFDVPVIFIIENNKYAYSTPISDQYRCKQLIDRAIGYGIDGHSVDGNDVVALYNLFKSIRDDIRARPRPVMVECDTMRMRGHGEHDDFSYVPKSLLSTYEQHDPITVAKEHYQREGIMTAAAMQALEATCQQAVDEAYRAALTDPPPAPESLAQGVYADG
ncbi:MAG: thiamine pyrophosphate-dependent enzyme, partial [Verrucomicrobia bacterium]|nr:thiamine pyrophosphate-dependent enzyme [Verrucomicrobiota bacterium]